MTFPRKSLVLLSCDANLALQDAMVTQYSLLASEAVQRGEIFSAIVLKVPLGRWRHWTGQPAPSPSAYAAST